MAVPTTREAWMSLVMGYQLERRSFAERHALHCMFADWLEEEGDEETASILRSGKFSVLSARHGGPPVICDFVEDPMGHDVLHHWSVFFPNPEKLLVAFEVLPHPGPKVRHFLKKRSPDAG